MTDKDMGNQIKSLYSSPLNIKDMSKSLPLFYRAQ